MLMLLGAAIGSAMAQRTPPSIEASGTNVHVHAEDLLLDSLNGRQTSSISIRELVDELSSVRAELSELRAAVANASTRDEVLLQTNAAVDGVLADIRSEVAAAVSPLDSRITATETRLVGSGGIVRTVATLAADIEYLRAHTANVTTCAADGNVHAGDGTCIDPVPQCPAPDAPAGGSVSLSADFVIPGVTATYSCAGARAFVAGPTVRTCREDTLAFDGSEPRCLTCNVANCLRCVNTTSTCAVCAYGHDLSEDSRSCVERAMTIVWLGGQYGRHNFRESQALDPNSNRFRYFYPYPPSGATGGAAAIMQGNTYLFSGGRTYKLVRGTTTWRSSSNVNGPSWPEASFAFYATINGEGVREDGFYIFGLNTGAVFQPAVDNSQWTRFATLSGDQEPRRFGATAVIGKLIYCIGGKTASNRPTSRVDIFNTTSRTWTEGTALPDARHSHSAAAFGGRIYVFGGRVSGLVSDSVIELNPATGQWVDKAPMPEAWEGMSTGPMPTYANGEVIIPHAYKGRTGVATSLKYDARANTWEAGPAVAIRNGRYAVAFGTYEG